MLDFLFRLGSHVTELNRLLGTRYVPGHPCMDTPLGMDLAKMFTLHNNGQHDLRDFELLRLGLLVKNLKEIDANRPDLLVHYKRELRRSSSSQGYYGVRFELNIAASLIRHGVPFVKSESPDFLIHGTTAGIECTSAHVSKSKPGSDMSYKIASCVAKKCGKDYVSLSVALFIDITNLCFATGRSGMAALCETATGPPQVESFGSVLLFTYLVNRRLQRFESDYWRNDAAHMTGDLRAVLDECFPKGEHVVVDYAVPREG